MKLTNEEKKVIADKMGLVFNPARLSLYDTVEGRQFLFSLSDASLVVDELVKQGNYGLFESYSLDAYNADNTEECPAWFSAWLMTMTDGEATNFFRAYYQWVKERTVK
jgi:hypothetical protein